MYVVMDDDIIYYIDEFSKRKTCAIGRHFISLLSDFYIITIYTPKEIFSNAYEFASRCNEQRILPSLLVSNIMKEMAIDKINRTITDFYSDILTNAIATLSTTTLVSTSSNKDSDKEISI